MDIFDNIIDIFVNYDRPVLFVSEINTAKYICVLIHETDEYEEWLASEITDQTYDSLISLRIDFYTCFKTSKFGKSQILKISDSQVKSVQEVLSSEVPDSSLPFKGLYRSVSLY